MTTLVLSAGEPFAARVLKRISRRGVRLFRFFSKALGAGATPGAPDGTEIRRIGEAEALELCSARQFDLRVDKVAAAYARGDACFAMLERGAPVAYCWLAYARLPHLDGVWVEFPRATAWIYKSLVLEPERGRGFAPALYAFAEKEALARRCGSAVICVELHNRASVQAALRAGYAAAGYAAYAARANGPLAWYSPAARRLGVRFGPR